MGVLMKKRMRQWIGILLTVSIFFIGTSSLARAGEREESLGELHATCAVLMDGDSGRVLYGKEEETARPNASTTKVMTCILALELGEGDEKVQISARAAAQPDVQLNLREGETYYLEDLLYSLMLRSHNDTAVAIAEHIVGSVEEFAKLMNEKAREIGCENTHFVTPNGLDDSDAGGVHSTTARDLALIMRYAIANPTFLKISQTREYSFSDLSGKRQFVVTNTNAFLDMMDGVIAGKTGFTADAGYCYVCAWQQDGRTLIVALLGCGWPNNKNYKWQDTRQLLTYGEEHYQLVSYWREPDLHTVTVQDGIPEDGELYEKACVDLVCECPKEDKTEQILLGDKEKIQIRCRTPAMLEAPVKAGTQVGTVSFYLDGKLFRQYPVVTRDTVEKISFAWCVDQIFHRFFH